MVQSTTNEPYPLETKLSGILEGFMLYLIRTITKLITYILLSIFIFSSYSNAQLNDPVLGIWKTIDEKTNKPSSLIRLDEKNGELIGVVTELIPTPGEALVTHCNLCKDERKGKAIIGMVIMKGLKRVGQGSWSGGEILDPEEGEIYKVKITMVNDKTLEVRGYIGIPLLGRTQLWVR
jgi:uncharacterized protein (DUF2147 family)